MRSVISVVVGSWIFLFGITSVYIVTSSAQSPASASRVPSPPSQFLLDAAQRSVNAGNLDQAADETRRALELEERELGPDHPSVGELWLKLGALSIRMRDFDRAEAALGKAQSIFTRAYGPESQQVSDVLVNLAALQLHRGKTENVEALYLHALAIREKHYGGENLHVARTVFDLAQYYQDRGAFVKAAPYYQRALTIRQKLLAVDDVVYRLTLARCACLLQKAGQAEQASAFEQRAGINGWPERESGDSDKPAKPKTGVDAASKSRLVKLASPDFPRFTHAILGGQAVRVNVLIDQTGQVISACASSTPALVSSIVENAALRSTFRPDEKSDTNTTRVASIWYKPPTPAGKLPNRIPIRPMPRNPFDPEIPNQSPVIRPR